MNNTDNSMSCISCGKRVKELQHYDTRPERNLWYGGIVKLVYAEYGSIHNTGGILICVCDDCVSEKHLKVSSNNWFDNGVDSIG